MIIKFGSRIVLDDWFNSANHPNAVEQIWNRKLIPYEDWDETIIVSVRLHAASIDKCYANFYSQLRFLHDYFPPDLEEPFYIEGDLDFAKKYVDDFLIKMSNLTAFL